VQAEAARAPAPAAAPSAPRVRFDADAVMPG
jgi:hypothetical protein